MAPSIFSTMNLLAVMPYYKPAYSFGGPVASAAELFEGLVRLGVRVEVLTTDADGGGSLDVPKGIKVDVNGVSVRYFRRFKMPQTSFYYSPGLKTACQESFGKATCGYFSATWTYPMLAGAHAAWDHQVPYIVCPRGSFMNWSIRYKRLKKRIYLSLLERKVVNRAAAIQCTSGLEQEQTAQLGFTPPSVIIPNSIDLARFAHLPKRGAIRERLGLPETALVTAFVGRLHPEKRVDLTIEAFAKVVRVLPEAHLVLAGADNGEGTKLKGQARALGLTGKVTFLGMLTGDDLSQIYSDSDLLVLLSWRENFGMVVLEAMAAGLPVLVSEGVGLAGEVQAAGAGGVVSSQPDEIASAWADLLADANLRRRCAANARRLAADSFSTETVAKKMLGLLNDLVERQRPSIR